jgi:uncharacterized protein (DUF3820 family)
VEERFLMDDEFLSKEKWMEIASYPMPFGKFKGRKLFNLPEEYYVWFKQKGWPPGKLGDYMQTVYEVKINQ